MYSGDVDEKCTELTETSKRNVQLWCKGCDTCTAQQINITVQQ